MESSTPKTDATGKAEWLQPREEEQGLRRYAETIRERLGLVLITVAITTAIALLYVLLAPKTYEARADLLVTPVSGDVGVLRSLPLIFESVDPTRDVETASEFVTNLDTARRVEDDLDTGQTPRELLAKVTAEPVAQSNIVAVTAKAGSADEARDLANAFAEATVDDRTAQIQAAIDRLIPIVQDQVDAASGATARDQAAANLSELLTLQDSPDPSLRVETRADSPTQQSSPRPVLSIAGGMFAGLILGIVGAFAAQALDPKLRREAQLRRLYRLPILARIPQERGRGTKAPLGPTQISPLGAEAYRTLRSTLEASRPEGSGSSVILVTGPAPAQGKSTTAVNLASSFALAGKEPLLIEADLRRPAVEKTLSLEGPVAGGVVGVLMGNIPLEEAVVRATTPGPGMKVLVADYSEGWIAELFSIPAAKELIEDARKLSDWVVIDSPPLNLVADAVPLARAADDVLIVVRIGETRINRIEELGELLAENGIRPVGFAVVGVPRPKRNESRYYHSEER